MRNPVFVYPTDTKAGFRVAWYGGESTQLHFQKFWNVYDLDSDQEHSEWTDRDVRTLGSGLPSSIKDLLMEMVDYYEYGCDMERERLSQLM
jgi:hypothetical protein